ncbi:MAG: hypothetical protein J6A58_07445 [Oscillospiraceae bacterium]|nr:hypothetical protein [Oscillospiraceae bacterium]
MKKIIGLILVMVLFFLGCNKNAKDTNFVRKSYVRDDDIVISSTIEPQSFDESNIATLNNDDINNIFVGNKNIYLSTYDTFSSKMLELGFVDMDNLEINYIDTDINCSYVYESCSNEKSIFIIYEKDYNNYIGIINRDTGKLIRSAQYNKVVVEPLIYFFQDKIVVFDVVNINNNIEDYITIYDSELNEINHYINICDKFDMSGYNVMFLDVTNTFIDMCCINKDTLDIIFVTVNDFFEDISRLPFDINLKDISLRKSYTLNSGNLLFEVPDYESGVTFLDEYDRYTGKVINSYTIEDTELKIIKGYEEYDFFHISDDSVYGFTSGDESPYEILAFEEDDKLLHHFYNAHYNTLQNELITYYNDTDPDEKIQILHDNVAETLFYYDNQKLYDVYVAYNDDIYSIFKSDDDYVIQVKSSDGIKKSEIQLELNENDVIIDFCVNSKGEIFIVKRNENIFYIIGFDSCGECIYEKSLENINNFYEIYSDSQDNINIYLNTFDGNTFYRISDYEITEIPLNEYLKLNTVNPSITLDSKIFVFSNNDGVYGYIFESGEIKTIVDYSKYELNCSVEDFIVINENELVYYGVDYITGDTTISSLKRKDSNSSIDDSKFIINVAQIGQQDDSVRLILRKYNRESDKYNIQVSNFENEQALNEAIGKGDIPDIVFYNDDNEIDLKRYVSEGYVENLSNYFKKDFSEEDYFTNLLKNNNSDIYRIAVGCGISFVINNTDKYISPEWSYEDMFSLDNEYENKVIMNTYEEITYKLLYRYIYDCINYDNETFDVDYNLLKSILSVIKLSYKNFDENFKSGINFSDVSDFISFSTSKNIIAYPGSDGNFDINLFNCAFIMKSSTHKDEAWNIVKQFIDEEYQSNLVEEMKVFPIKISSFEKKANIERSKCLQYGYKPYDTALAENLKNIFLEKSRVIPKGCLYINNILDETIEQLCLNNIEEDKATEKIITDIKRYVLES